MNNVRVRVRFRFRAMCMYIWRSLCNIFMVYMSHGGGCCGGVWWIDGCA
ncbi:MAG: hypothetical protein QXK74_08345 [Candidatus Nitrosocaldaceae archaeon]